MTQNINSLIHQFKKTLTSRLRTEDLHFTASKDKEKKHQQHILTKVNDGERLLEVAGTRKHAKESYSNM